MRRGQFFQFWDQFRVAPEAELRLDAALNRLELQLPEACGLVAREDQIPQAIERCSAPEFETGPKHARSPRGIATCQQVTPAGDAALETYDVHRLRGEVETVATSMSRDHAGPQHLSKRRY